jgi:hypothetical protein
MPLLGKAALAMWWDVSADVRPEWEHWHAHEHFPERLALPGFLRASRWTDVSGGEAYFVMYELQDHAVLASAPYLARLNAPSPWSTRMMPLHRNMVRAPCRVVHSCGAATARHALTVRCSPLHDQVEALQRGLAELATQTSQQPGMVGLHVLCHDAPPLAVTTEQKIRGNADRAADWVIVASGYDMSALSRLAATELGDAGLRALGAQPGAVRHIYGLAYSATRGDVH